MLRRNFGMIKAVVTHSLHVTSGDVGRRSEAGAGPPTRRGFETLRHRWKKGSAPEKQVHKSVRDESPVLICRRVKAKVFRLRRGKLKFYYLRRNCNYLNCKNFEVFKFALYHLLLITRCKLVYTLNSSTAFQVTKVAHKAMLSPFPHTDIQRFTKKLFFFARPNSSSASINVS